MMQREQAKAAKEVLDKAFHPYQADPLAQNLIMEFFCGWVTNQGWTDLPAGVQLMKAYNQHVVEGCRRDELEKQAKAAAELLGRPELWHAIYELLVKEKE